ncbi:hypothetical protein AVEN_142879-1 [Araneus ventricosus]|uniref:Uncharacterized protein n=1 Tax=Araneus ventricosus TaxID=182803 RepID=A0A4Y2WMP8_ARAVE|nr:hypothetical protein AVEN_183092-1 [Araneus ventricosus]GBO37978.1 hypothetical protein AVEN_142879-1 [Araneus ventricosus]
MFYFVFVCREVNYRVEGGFVDTFVFLSRKELYDMTRIKELKRKDSMAVLVESLMTDPEAPSPLQKDSEMITLDRAFEIFAQRSQKPEVILTMHWLLKCTSSRLKELTGCLEEMLNYPDSTRFAPAVFEYDPEGPWTLQRVMKELGEYEGPVFDPTLEHRKVLAMMHRKRGDTAESDSDLCEL